MTIFIAGAPKVVPQDIKDVGFFSEMFGQMASDAFDTYLSNAIDGQAALLSARIGAALYDTTDETQGEYVKQAEKQLVIAEMWRLRIARKLGQAQGGAPTCKYEVEARDKAQAEAENWIFRLIGGDYAGGFADTSHFDEDLEGFPGLSTLGG